MRHAAVAIVLFAACAQITAPLELGPLDGSLEAAVVRQEKWVLSESDGSVSVLTPRSVRNEVARAWLRVVREERMRVAAWLKLPMVGKLELRVVDRFPDGFEADGFSSAKRVFVKGNPDAEPRSAERDLIGHELVHVFLASQWKVTRPFWFEEGLATYIEGESLGFGGTGTSLLAGTVGLEALDSRKLMFADLHSYPPRLGYRLAALAIDDFLVRHGKSKLLALGREAGDFEGAYAVVTGETVSLLEERWRSAIRAEILRRSR